MEPFQVLKFFIIINYEKTMWQFWKKIPYAFLELLPKYTWVYNILEKKIVKKNPIMKFFVTFLCQKAVTFISNVTKKMSQNHKQKNYYTTNIHFIYLMYIFLLLIFFFDKPHHIRTIFFTILYSCVYIIW